MDWLIVQGLNDDWWIDEFTDWDEMIEWLMDDDESMLNDEWEWDKGDDAGFTITNSYLRQRRKDAVWEFELKKLSKIKSPNLA